MLPKFPNRTYLYLSATCAAALLGSWLVWRKHSTYPYGISDSKTEIAWVRLEDARRCMLQAIDDGAHDRAGSISEWIGGGIAVLADWESRGPQEILEELKTRVPQPGPQSRGGMRFVKTNTGERPKPHPGAPKPVPPEDVDLEVPDGTLEGMETPES